MISIRIDKTIIGKRGIIDYIESHINSPYTNDNWDGFEEAITDLCWLHNKEVRLIHLEWPQLESKDMETYISILKYAVSDGKKYIANGNSLAVYLAKDMNPL